jgi:lysophospholipase L1-like esterase
MTAPHASPNEALPPGRRQRRVWAFRAISVLLGLSLLPASELLCVVCDIGRPTEFDDPFVGFSAVHPLFVLDGTGAKYEIPPSRRRFFAPESFPAVKPAGTFRVFCLGESTVQGHPYSKETSFTTWLQLGLTAADSSRRWEVVNCGGVSYASYRLAPILQECLNYQPDLFVLAIGHNEFLEDRTYGRLKRERFPGQVWLSHRRIVVLLRHTWQQGRRAAAPPSDQRPVLPSETNPRLDTFGGLRDYHHDDAWHAGVAEHYEFNLRRMVRLAQAARVPVIAIRQPSNLNDCEPFKSEHRVLNGDDALVDWESLRLAAQQGYHSNLPRAVEQLQELALPEDRYAAVHYELGKCLETLRRYPEARAAFVRARDYDVCPLRMTSELEARLEKVCTELGVPLLDAHALLEASAPHGILGGPLLVDHVHPSFEGHQQIADALVDLMAAQGWVQPAGNWRSAAHAAYRRHFASLDEMYFLRGLRTLNSVRAWTQGRAGIPPMEPSHDDG